MGLGAKNTATFTAERDMAIGSMPGPYLATYRSSLISCSGSMGVAVRARADVPSFAEHYPRYMPPTRGTRAYYRQTRHADRDNALLVPGAAAFCALAATFYTLARLSDHAYQHGSRRDADVC